MAGMHEQRICAEEGGAQGARTFPTFFNFGSQKAVIFGLCTPWALFPPSPTPSLSQPHQLERGSSAFDASLCITSQRRRCMLCVSHYVLLPAICRGIQLLPDGNPPQSVLHCLDGKVPGRVQGHLVEDDYCSCLHLHSKYFW